MRAVNHRRNHAFEAEEQAELPGHKGHGEGDANESGDKPNAIMKQVAGGEREDQRHCGSRLRKLKVSGGVHRCSEQVNTISAYDHTEAKKTLTATIDAHNHGSKH